MTPTERHQAEAAGQLAWLVAELDKYCTAVETEDGIRLGLYEDNEGMVEAAEIRALIDRVQL